jgi:hypothetical protein
LHPWKSDFFKIFTIEMSLNFRSPVALGFSTPHASALGNLGRRSKPRKINDENIICNFKVFLVLENKKN